MILLCSLSNALFSLHNFQVSKHNTVGLSCSDIHFFWTCSESVKTNFIMKQFNGQRTLNIRMSLKIKMSQILTEIFCEHVSQNFLVFSAFDTSVLEVLIRCS